MESRPKIRAWALAVQGQFARLYHATSAAGSAPEVCAAALDVLEQMPAVLLPTPSLDLDALLSSYLEELTAFYREAPSESGSARALHRRADEAGWRLEAAVNRRLDGLLVPG